jgi:hypothetical protein
MNYIKTKWNRVSRRHPCPICDHADWCLVAGPADAPDAAICARVESQSRCGEAGWLHRLRDDLFRPERRSRRFRIDTPVVAPIDFAAMALDYKTALGCHAKGLLAATLGVSERSLGRLGAGWSARHRASTFPMRDGAGHVVGIRLRGTDGRKWAVKGSRQGIFFSDTLNTCADRLLICEGPTDCAALLDLGFDVIGRPSCNSGNGSVLSLVLADWRFVAREVVIVADNDSPGQRGAWKLATMLVSYVSCVRIFAPPDGIKDAREWVQSGATRFDIEFAIDAAPALQLTYGVKAVAR